MLYIHHDDFLTRHFEIKKTRSLLQRKFYWFKMLKDIKNIFRTAMFVNAWKRFVIHFMTRRRYFSYQFVFKRKSRWILLSSFSLIVIKTIYTMLYLSQSIVIRKWHFIYLRNWHDRLKVLQTYYLIKCSWFLSK